MTSSEPESGLRDAIVVPGVGRVSVEPDVANVRLGVMLTRPTAAAAREDAAVTMNAVLARLSPRPAWSGGTSERRSSRCIR